jgi:hypothetical protein
MTRLSEEQLEALEHIIDIDRTLLPIRETLRSVLEEVRDRRVLFQLAAEDATQAAKRYAELEAYTVRTRAALDACIETFEKQEAHLERVKKANTELGAIALSLTGPQDQMEQARIRALLKVGSDDNAAQGTSSITIVPG